MSFPEALMRRRRAREPMDERLPDGRTVDELLWQAHPPLGAQPARPAGVPANAHFDPNPFGGEWIAPAPQQSPQGQAVPPDRTADPSATRQRAVSFDPQTGKPKEEFYRDKGDTPGLYGAYQNWEPRGAKRGFKNSLKSGAMMAAEAVRNNPNDPVTAAIAGFGIGAAGGTAAPNFKNRLTRKWKLDQVGGEAKNALDLQKQQQVVEAGQMVEVELENGQRVMVPAKQAGTLSSQQQRIRQQDEGIAERRRVNDNRKRHWDAMDSRDRKRLILSLYNTGGLNDPELLEYAADQLGLPATMREKFISGQMRDAIDEEGNLIQVNRQTNEVTETGRKSYEATKEGGRQRRFEQGQANTDRRAANRPARSTAPDRASGRKAAQLVGVIERARREMEAQDALGPKGDGAKREQARLMGEQAASELNALEAGYEAGPGEKGYPYYKKNNAQPAQQGSRSIDGAIEAFTRKVGRAPTADEIAKMKAALGQ